MVRKEDGTGVASGPLAAEDPVPAAGAAAAAAAVHGASATPVVGFANKPEDANVNGALPVSVGFVMGGITANPGAVDGAAFAVEGNADVAAGPAGTDRPAAGAAAVPAPTAVDGNDGNPDFVDDPAAG